MKRTSIRKGVVLFDMLRLLCAVLLPPVGVLLTVGLGFHFWLNIVLTLFGIVPGIIHAVWLMATR